MGWFFRDQRSGLSWRDQTIGSMSAPPLQLVALFALVILLMSMSSYTEMKVHIEREKMGLKMLLYLLPIALVLVADVLLRYRWARMAQAASLPVESVKQDGSCPPWRVAFVVILVLVLVKYHSSVQSGWF